LKLKVIRSYFLPYIVAGLILISAVLLFNRSISLQKEGTALKAQKEEFLMLRGEFLELRKKIDVVEAKKSLSRAEGIVQAIDELLKPSGLNRKVKSVKPTGTRVKKHVEEEEAVIEFDKMDMNEMINILYKIENAPMILLIKKTTLKTSFQNPDLIDMSIRIAFVKPK
jgi:hypothetical protein